MRRKRVLGHIPKEIAKKKNRAIYIKMFIAIIFLKGKKMEIIQMFNNRYIIKHIIAYKYNVIHTNMMKSH